MAQRDQRKVEMKISGFSGVTHGLRQIFVKKAKNDPKHFLNGKTSTKKEIGKIQRCEGLA